MITASVGRALLWPAPTEGLPELAVSPDNPNPKELLSCAKDVDLLLRELHQQTTELLARPLRRDARDIASGWMSFSGDWQLRSNSIGARCGFSELGEGQLGDVYEGLARVHRDLGRMRLMYQTLLLRFDEEQAAELATMRQTIDQARDTFASYAN